MAGKRERTENVGSEALGFYDREIWKERGLQNGSDWRRSVERGPHFLPTLKLLYFPTLSFVSFKGSSPTSEHFLAF